MEKQARHLANYFHSIFHPGDLIEIRALGGESISALFTDFDKAARYAVWLSDHGRDVFYTLNPITKSCETATSHHPWDHPRLRSKRSARDLDIACRNLYAIDLDAVRPSGQPSTLEQLQATRTVANTVAKYTTLLGWSEPIVVSSGNGTHLLYAAERTVADPCWWRCSLRVLAGMFDTEAVKIDQSVWNMSRILRAPGTRNLKGQQTAEQPHRIARVLSYAEVFRPVSDKQVQELALRFYEEPRRDRASSELVIDADGVEELIEEFSDVLTLHKTTQRGDAIHFGLAECPFVERAHRGQHVGTGKTVLILNEAEGYLGFKCFSDECSRHTIGDFLRLLHKRTGRRPSMDIWLTDDTWMDEADRRLGTVITWELPSPRCERSWVDTYDLTFEEIAPMFREIARAEIRYTQDRDLTAWLQRINDEEDIQEMACFIGREQIADLHRHLREVAA